MYYQILIGKVHEYLRYTARDIMTKISDFQKVLLLGYVQV